MTFADTFVVETNPSPADIEFLNTQINAFNVAQTGIRPSDDLLLAIFVRDADGAILAGIFGWTWGGCCEIRYLWVDARWRGQGYGRRLLAAAEAEACRRRCQQVILDTHSFQAPAFYQRFGYVIVAVIDNYPQGYQKYLLKKDLPSLSESLA